MPNPTPFPSLLQRFFAEHLLTHRHVSPQTIAAYRDTFRLLLHFLCDHLRCPVDQLPLTAISAENVLAFLAHLESARGNTVRTRNARLAAVRSFTRFALAHVGPEFLPTGQRVLAVPMKRFNRPLLGCLSREEVSAILDSLDGASWNRRRDRLFFTLMYNTGARVSELTSLRLADLTGDAVHLHGKGRKERAVPLWPQTRRLLLQWSRTNRLQPDHYLFTNRHGSPLTRAGASSRLRVAVRSASAVCPSLAQRRISPHTLRHTTAFHLLQSGVALEVIALWLGHESPVTTHHYIEADLKMKDDVLRKLEAPAPPKRIRRTQYPRLLAFLEAL